MFSVKLAAGCYECHGEGCQDTIMEDTNNIETKACGGFNTTHACWVGTTSLSKI